MLNALKLDTLFGLMAILLYFIVVLIAQVNPPQDPQIKQPGNIFVNVAWPAGDNDVDLWLASPKDGAIGFSNKSGVVWSLLRDDLGNSGDETPLNYEYAASRGTPDGEYFVNLRCYRCAGPIEVDAEIRLATGALVWRGVVKLVGDKDERTVLGWRMYEGKVVNGSASKVFREMRR